MKFKVTRTTGSAANADWHKVYTTAGGDHLIDLDSLGELIEFTIRNGGLLVLTAEVGDMTSLEIYDDYRE